MNKNLITATISRSNRQKSNWNWWK